MKRKQKKETKYRKRFASVTQWQSNRLLTGRLRVRVPPGALRRRRGLTLCNFYIEKYVTVWDIGGNQNIILFQVHECGVAKDATKLKQYSDTVSRINSTGRVLPLLSKLWCWYKK